MRQELIEKVKAAKSAEELLALAKENNVEMTAEEANTYFAQLTPQMGELGDDELDNVSGGGCEGPAAVSPPTDQFQLSSGQKVYLKEPGHTFGSCYCQNSVCASSVFRIAKQIDAEKFLLECMGCDWTYHAVKDNIKLL